VRVCLTGRVGVAADRRAATHLTGNRAQVAFAMLVLRRERPVLRDELADAMWPAGLPASWEPGVRTVVSQLRAFLDAVGIPSAEGLRRAFGCYQLCLPDGAVIDIEEAERSLGTAVQALNAGETDRAKEAALTTVMVTAQPFLPAADGEWVESIRRRLQGLRVQALDTLCEAYLDLGEEALALQAAEEAVAMEPYRESSHVLVMRAHAAAENRGEALRAYDRLRSTLVEHLGVSPSPPAAAMYLSLLGEEPVADAPVQRAGPVFPPSLAAADGGELLGRDEEMTALTRLVQAAGEGSATLAVIAGPLGVGKTRLAAEVARAAHADGAAVWFGRCDPLLPMPFGPFVEVVRAVLRAGGGAGAGLAPLARLAPDLVPAPHKPPQAHTTDSELDRYLLLEAVAELLAGEASSAPTILVLDDLQWCPPPALHLLLHLFRAHPRAPICVIATERTPRTEGRPPEVEPLWAELHRLRSTTVLHLGGLGAPHLGAIVRRTLTPSLGLSEPELSNLSARIGDAAGGNPLFAVTATRDFASRRRTGMPDAPFATGAGLRDIVRGQLAALTDRASLVVGMAAVLGEDPSRVVLAKACGDFAGGMENVELATHLDAAAAAGVLSAGAGAAGHAQFVHGLLRETIYADLAHGRRAQMHRAAGEARERLSTNPSQLPALARHFSEAASLGYGVRAVRYAGAAANSAAQALAFDDAVQGYRRALDLLDRWVPADDDSRFEILLALGRAEDDQGQFAAADETFELAAGLARRNGWAAQQAMAALNFGGAGTRTRAHDRRRCMALLDEAYEALGPDQPALRTRIAARIHRFAIEGGPHASVARDISGDHAWRIGQLEEQWWASLPEGRLAIAEELVDMGRRHGADSALAVGLLWRWISRVEAGRATLQDPEPPEVATSLAGAASPYLAWVWDVWRAAAATGAGRLDDGERLADAAHQNALRNDDGLPAATPAFLATLRRLQLAVITLHRGGGGRMAPEDVAPLDDHTRPRMVQFDLLDAFVHAWSGNAEPARRALAVAAESDFAHVADNSHWLATMCQLGRLAVLTREATVAERLAVKLDPYRGFHEVVGIAAYLGAVDLTLGRLVATAGDLDQALAILDDATAAHRAVGSLSFEAVSLRERAAVLRRRGRSGDTDEATRLDGLAAGADKVLGHVTRAYLGEARLPAPSPMRSVPREPAAHGRPPRERQ
jgi:DNA-binding SARP family transcriptional activator/tetratricopeptide (TPR) repeat protein